MKENLLRKCEDYLETLCFDISERCVGSEGNRQATYFLEKVFSQNDWETEMVEFDAIDWEQDSERGLLLFRCLICQKECFGRPEILSAGTVELKRAFFGLRAITVFFCNTAFRQLRYLQNGLLIIWTGRILGTLQKTILKSLTAGKSLKFRWLSMNLSDHFSLVPNVFNLLLLDSLNRLLIQRNHDIRDYRVKNCPSYFSNRRVEDLIKS